MTAAQFLAEWMVRSSILIAAGAVLLRGLRVKDASIKLAAWTAMLGASFSIPLLMTILPTVPLRVIPQSAKPAAVSAPATLAAVPLNVQAPAIEIPQRSAIEQSFDWRRAALLAYFSVAGFLLLRLLVGLAMAMRVVHRSRKTNLRWDAVEVCESELLSSPVTMGVLRPVVLLPADWREWDATSLNAVLAHEAAHVRRHDPAIQALSAMHRALLWLSPLSWVLHRQLVRLAEEASDEAAVAVTRDRCSYAEVLLGFMQRGMRYASWHGAAMARYERPETRIGRVLNATGFSRGVTRKSVALILGIATPLACFVAAGRAAAAPKAAISHAVTPSTQAEATQPSKTSSAPPTTKQAAPAKPKTTPAPAKAAAPAPSTATQPAIAGQNSASIQRYLIVDGNSMSGSWNTDDTDVEGIRQKFGNHFAWFRANGNEYIITDAGVLEEFRKANAPQEGVNKMQADVNAHQAEVNQMQSNVNAMQNKVNDLQHVVNRRQDIVNQLQSSVNQDSNQEMIQKLEQALQELRSTNGDANQELVNKQQASVNEAQEKVNAKQSEVNAMQQKVNEQQQQVNVEYRRRIQEIFQSALSRGLAQQLM